MHIWINRPEVVKSVEHLKILHDICPDHAFNYWDFDSLYTEYEAKFPPLPGQDKSNAKQEGGEEIAVVNERVAADADKLFFILLMVKTSTSLRS